VLPDRLVYRRGRPVWATHDQILWDGKRRACILCSLYRLDKTTAHPTVSCLAVPSGRFCRQGRRAACCLLSSPPFLHTHHAAKTPISRLLPSTPTTPHPTPLHPYLPHCPTSPYLVGAALPSGPTLPHPYLPAYHGANRAAHARDRARPQPLGLARQPSRTRLSRATTVSLTRTRPHDSTWCRGGTAFAVRFTCTRSMPRFKRAFAGVRSNDLPLRAYTLATDSPHYLQHLPVPFGVRPYDYAPRFRTSGFDALLDFTARC